MSDALLLVIALACCVAIVVRAGDARMLALIAGLCILAVLIDGVHA